MLRWPSRAILRITWLHGRRRNRAALRHSRISLHSTLSRHQCPRIQISPHVLRRSLTTRLIRRNDLRLRRQSEMGQRSRCRYRTGTYRGRNRITDPETILLEYHIREYFRGGRAPPLSSHCIEILESWALGFPFRRQIPILSPHRPLALFNRIPLLRYSSPNGHRSNRSGSLAVQCYTSNQVWAKTLLSSPERSAQLPISEPLETSKELRYCRPCSREVLRPESIREPLQNLP